MWPSSRLIDSFSRYSRNSSPSSLAAERLFEDGGGSGLVQRGVGPLEEQLIGGCDGAHGGRSLLEGLSKMVCAGGFAYHSARLARASWQSMHLTTTDFGGSGRSTKRLQTSACAGIPSMLQAVNHDQNCGQQDDGTGLMQYRQWYRHDEQQSGTPRIYCTRPRHPGRPNPGGIPSAARAPPAPSPAAMSRSPAGGDRTAPRRYSRSGCAAPDPRCVARGTICPSISGNVL